MHKVIINPESRFPYEVWLLQMNGEEQIQDGTLINGFQLLEDAISNAEMLNMKER